ncbi:MAG: sigma-70 family RNA polymerase sigma factor [Phycisphaera sp.]|nr:sigma-70 family RNA polymerase sigma factor [Phycisphaera sp.]
MTKFDPEESRTTTEMLAALHDPDEVAAWEVFDARYRPVLVGFARNLGLDAEESADVAQETIARFVEQYREGRYDRERGRLGAWLVGIARYRILDVRRAHGRRALRGDSAMVDMDDDASLSSVWEAERRTRIIGIAMERLRAAGRTDSRTIEAFELLMVHGLTAAVVAEQLGMPVQSVYVAKSRIAARLQDLVAEVESEFDEEA